MEFLTTSNNLHTDKDHTFIKYDFSSLITELDDQEIKACVKDIIANGSYFKNSPKYQTQVNVFARPEPCWLKLRMSFIFSCFMYLGKEVQIKNMQAWSFMTNNEIEENRDDLWHTHHLTKTNKSISGIYYVHIPSDADFATSGTEFAPNGLEDPNRLLLTPSKGSWLIYPSDILHRPTVPQSKDYRFIVAADMEF